MKRDYLSRLTLWARWYLPEKEAAEVLEDYRELIEQEPRSEEDLRRDIGNPRESARRLIQPGFYRRWLTVFGVMAACTLVPALIAAKEIFGRAFTYFIFYSALALAIGISLLWFHREGRREKKLPKSIPFFMAVVLIGAAWAWFLAWIVLSENWAFIEFFFPPEKSELLNMYRGQLIQRTLFLCGIVMMVISLFGLIKARLGDRRWRAVYIFALMGSLIALSVYGILTCMSFYPGWQITTALRLVFLTIMGLIGTAVSLC